MNPAQNYEKISEKSKISSYSKELEDHAWEWLKKAVEIGGTTASKGTGETDKPANICFYPVHSSLPSVSPVSEKNGFSESVEIKPLHQAACFIKCLTKVLAQLKVIQNGQVVENS